MRFIPKFSYLAQILAATCALAQPTFAQDRAHGVPVSRNAGTQLEASLKLYDESSDSWARIDFENPDLTVGQLVAVCATARQSGYLSVWSRTLDGARPTRIFPNDFTPEDRQKKGGEITEGQELCLGDGKQGFGFEVLPPALSAEVYLHWSPDLAGQFAPEDIPVIPDHSAGASRNADAPYSATVLRYRVTE